MLPRRRRRRRRRDGRAGSRRTPSRRSRPVAPPPARRSGSASDRRCIRIVARSSTASRSRNDCRLLVARAPPTTPRCASSARPPAARRPRCVGRPQRIDGGRRVRHRWRCGARTAPRTGPARPGRTRPPSCAPTAAGRTAAAGCASWIASAASPADRGVGERSEIGRAVVVHRADHRQPWVGLVRSASASGCVPGTSTAGCTAACARRSVAARGPRPRANERTRWPRRGRPRSSISEIRARFSAAVK